MKLSRLLTKQNSRIGRRIVATFLLAALLPLLVFAFKSHETVSQELHSAATRRLQRDVKSVGVTLVERLAMAAQLLQQDRSGVGRSVPLIHTNVSDQRQVFCEELEFECSAAEGSAHRATIAKHGLSMRIVPDDEEAILWLISWDEEAAKLRAARIANNFVFRPEGMERPPSKFSVQSVDGIQLYSVGSSAPAMSDLRGPESGDRVKGEFSFLDHDGDRRRGVYWQVFLSPRYGQDLMVTVHESTADIMAPLADFRRDFILIVALTAGIVILASLMRVRKIVGPVQSLVEAAARIGRQETGVRVEAEGPDEFGTLANAFNDMAKTLEHRAEVIEAVNEFGASLAKETEPRALVNKLMRGAALMLDVDGVVVYVRNHDDRLELDHLRIRSLDIELERDRHGSCALYSMPLSALTKEVQHLPHLQESEHDLARVLRGFTATRDFELRDALVVPMLDHDGEVVGALAVFNSTRVEGEDSSLTAESADLACSLASQASLGIVNARLRDEFKSLFDAMIEVLAVAVDEKSPYTGGHCRRVPKLALMLFDEVQAAATGPFASTRFTADEAYEMQVASLLHDCGKVVTPVHVVDKATKLETIYDRIAAVEERMAMVVAGRERDALRSELIAAGIPTAGHDQAMAKLRQQHKTDLEFLCRANVGGEFMRDEDVARVAAISEFWSFADDQGESRDLLSADELLNLSIRKGTLNDEERRVINYHMDATIMMLDQLPFPRRLKDVSLIAGSHHERMDGKGFPRGLDASTIPLQGRMLAVADVFEALTATDRPYKKGMGLAQSLKIMAFMARDGHLDPELLRCFIETGVWQRYGAEVLTPEQLDEVDVDAVLAIFAAAALNPV